MKASDLREKSVEDLHELEKSLVRDVFQSRLKNFTNRLDDTSSIRKTKRDLARVTTVLRELEIGIVRTTKGVAPTTKSVAPTAQSTAPATKKSTARATKSVAGATKKRATKKSEAKP
jgi:large subunit ribosomal protein L29